MQAFADLYTALDSTTRTQAKLDELTASFDGVDPHDGAWAVYILTGRRMKRLVGPRRLREWLAEASGLPDWLVEETYQHVGDLAETISLLMEDDTERPAVQGSFAEWVEQSILSLRDLEEHVIALWRRLPRHGHVQVEAVSGNHDRHAEGVDIGIAWYAALDIGPFHLCHEPQGVPGRHVLAGHLRPVYSLSAASDRLRAPVLWCRDGVAVLPSFGVLTGGWEIELQAGDGAILIVEGELYPLGLGAGR